MEMVSCAQTFSPRLTWITSAAVACLCVHTVHVPLSPFPTASSRPLRPLPSVIEHLPHPPVHPQATTMSETMTAPVSSWQSASGSKGEHARSTNTEPDLTVIWQILSIALRLPFIRLVSSSYILLVSWSEFCTHLNQQIYLLLRGLPSCTNTSSPASLNQACELVNSRPNKSMSPS